LTAPIQEVFVNFNNEGTYYIIRNSLVVLDGYSGVPVLKVSNSQYEQRKIDISIIISTSLTLTADDRILFLFNSIDELAQRIAS
jgi:hypothetical protein